MNKPVPYNGTEPFIFISYSYKDSDIVLPIIERMVDDGFYVWFDEGTEEDPASRDFISQKINSSYMFLAFVSENYLGSERLISELNLARDESQTKLLVYLSGTGLTQELKERLGKFIEFDASEFTDKDSLYENLSAFININEELIDSSVEINPQRVDDAPKPTRINQRKKWRYPDTRWGRWGLPGFRTNKLSHKIGAVILYIFSIGFEFYFIDDFLFYLDKYNGKTKAYASLWIAIAYFIMLVFSTNYGWVQDSVFKTYKKPVSARVGVIAGFDFGMILLTIAIVFLTGIRG